MRNRIAVLALLAASTAFAQQTQGPTSAISPGTFTNLASHCGSSAFVNGASMSMFASSGDTNYTMDGLCGAVINPPGATNSQSNGVSGMVDNHANGVDVSASPAAMGVYAQVRQYGGSGTAAWGFNAVGIVEPSINQTTLLNEVDFDLLTSVTNATVIGWEVNAPYFDSAPLQSYGFDVVTPGCHTTNFGTYPYTGCPQWQYGFATQAGATPIGLLLSPISNFGNSKPSQSIQLTAFNSSGVPIAGTAQMDSNGNIIFTPAASGGILLNGNILNGNGTVIPSGVTGYHGANTATKVQLSDNTGTSGNLTKWDVNGNVTNGPAIAGAGAAVPTGPSTSTTNDVVCYADTSGTLKDCSKALPLSGTTGSIGGSALTAGQCASGTATINGATAGMLGSAAATDGTYQSGYIVQTLGTASNTATVYVCAIVAGTPTAKTYNVRLIQ
jgi:hypothetical protein